MTDDNRSEQEARIEQRWWTAGSDSPATGAVDSANFRQALRLVDAVAARSSRHAHRRSGARCGHCVALVDLGLRFSRTPYCLASRAALIAGIRAVPLHAMSDDAKRFYERAGFHECPVDPMMMITLADAEKNLRRPPRADDLQNLLWGKRTSTLSGGRVDQESPDYAGM